MIDTSRASSLRGRVVKTSPLSAVVGRRFEPCTASGGPMSNHLKGAILAGAGVLWIALSHRGKPTCRNVVGSSLLTDVVFLRSRVSEVLGIPELTHRTAGNRALLSGCPALSRL